MATPVSGKVFDLSVTRKVLRYVSPYRARFFLAITTTLLLALLSVGRPLLVLYAINESIQRGDAKMLGWCALAMVALLIAEAVLQFFNSYMVNYLGQNIIKDLRVDLHRHVINFKQTYFDNTPVGTLVTRVVSDIEAIADIFSQGFITIMGDILTLIVFVTWMLLVDWQLALVTLSTVPLLLFATYIFKNAVKSAFTDVRNAVARLNAFVQEHITGMRIVQVFSREEKEYEKFVRINNDHRDANIRSVWHYSVFFPVVEVLQAASLGLLLWYGGRKMFNLEIQVGEITFFIMLTTMVFRPIRMLADRINTLQMGLVAADRVFKVLETESIISSNGKITAEHLKGEIEFKNVWFAYKDDEWILKDLSFKVKPGETLALVGSTGSGKTSVINLLCRFYEFQKGQICIDGLDIREYELSSLRKNIGIVLQDVFLFSDTVKNNITLNNDAIDESQVVEAAKEAGAHEFISNLPGEYKYNVRERGGMLSAGQRQLLSFIRAFVYKPSMLVLDEATSSIDTESEILIQKATSKLTKGRTSIIIAHRLATIRMADRIMVMENGRILESGSHDDLIGHNGHYRKLVELQFKQN